MASRTDLDGDDGSPYETFGADHLETQIALDEVAAGSEDALKLLLARMSGLDETDQALMDSFVVRQTPFNFSEAVSQPESQMQFLGQIDALEPMDSSAIAPQIKSPTLSHYIDFAAERHAHRYVYEPLAKPSQQIRLLQLGRCDQQCSATHEVAHNHFDRLEVRTFDLHDAPIYYCLSYVWGDPETFISVNCDGKALGITQNLYAALQKIFNRYPDCYLWADGICINQADDHEKSEQVMLMKQIYTKCQMTIAHPGHHKYRIIRSSNSIEGDQDQSNLSTLTQDIGNADRSLPQYGHQVAGGVNVFEEGRIASDIDESIREPRGALLELPHTTDHSVMFEQEVSSIGTSPSSEQNEKFVNMSQARSALSLMNLLTRIWSFQRYHPEYEAVPDSQWEQFDIPECDNSDGNSVWENVIHFWQEDWMFRAWVLPECILASKVVVMYSDYLISLDFIIDFWDSASKHGLPNVLRHGLLADILGRMLLAHPARTISRLRKRPTAPAVASHEAQTTDHESNSEPAMAGGEVDVSARAQSLLEVLAVARSCKATDSRDKVYSLLGLTDDPLSKTIVPDYSPGKTLLQTFVEVAELYVDAGSTIDLLEHAGIDTKIEGLPSWVPDWTHQSRSRLLTHLYHVYSDKDAPPPRLDGKKLAISAAKVSTIRMVGPAWRFFSGNIASPSFLPMKGRDGELVELPPFSDEDGRCFLVDFALQIAQDSDKTSKLYTEDLGGVVARTLCADRSWAGERLTNSEEALQKFRDSFDAFQKFYAEGPPDENPNWHNDPAYADARVHQPGLNIFAWLLRCTEKEAEQLMAKLWPFAMALQETMRGRRFAVLESGHLAVLPWNAQNGDVVMLISGGKMPFVIRESDPSDSIALEHVPEYNLIGDCYVHGMMDSEPALAQSGVSETENGSRPSLPKWQTISLV